MKRRNAVIKEVAYYHPENVVTNEFYLDHFNKMGRDITPLLEITGRNKRYISKDPNETMLTMGIEASKSALKKANLKAEDIDLIVFSSGTPEYVQPTNAVKLHYAIGGKKKTTVYDVNCNCVGMVVALEQVCRVMRDNPKIKYALIVGSEQLTKYSRFEEEITYSNFGDSGCALLLENKEETESGFIDSDCFTDSTLHECINFPAMGLSKAIHDKHLPISDKLIQWLPFDTDEAFASAVDGIDRMVQDNGLHKDDIKKYFFSQFAKKNIDMVREKLEVSEEKFPYIGDEFGYTGTTSPMITLAKTLERGELARGENIVFWSVGAGITCSCVLMKY
ncbi:MAG: ketoacyl-ACP synthase III [Clostridiaceae bacterium]|nr:ketoacyl-ACP synthase III [Clostridiaceae bacterium]